MQTRENHEKLLEMAMLTAIRNKIYSEQRLALAPGQRSERDYKEACRECVEICSKLFRYYADDNM